MKDRITVLMGAGAMIEFTKVSTDSLTGKILNGCQQFKACNYLQPSNKLCKHNQCQCQKSVVEFVRDIAGEDANFEVIFHLLELINNYRQNCSSVKKDYSDVEKVLIALKDNLSDINFSSVYFSIYEMINIINKEIYAYDSCFKQKGVSFKSFFDKLLESGQYCLDIFNLNYDTWVEQSIPEYVDGFIASDNMDKGIKRFDSKEYIKEQNQNHISHLHGQIYFDFADLSYNDYADTQDMLYKYNSFKDAEEIRKRRIQGLDTTQSGRKIIYSNIVTGLFKTDKILWYPLDVYYSSLVRSLIKNKRLIIIGYGFADLYINKSLILHYNANIDDKKIIMIDMKDNNNGENPYSSCPFQSNTKKNEYLERVFQCNQWYKNYKQEGRDAFFYSEKEGVCVYGNGFDEVIHKNMNEILKFL